MFIRLILSVKYFFELNNDKLSHYQIIKLSGIE